MEAPAPLPNINIFLLFFFTSKNKDKYLSSSANSNILNKLIKFLKYVLKKLFFFFHFQKFIH